MSLDLDKSRVFVTVPRFTQGIPVTLGFLKQGKEKLRIQPYPDYSWHSSHGDDCNGITSVLRVAIDSCHQLYVLDTGLIGENRICPPQLLVFNLRNDQLIRRYKFPSSQYSDKSLFIAPVRLIVADRSRQHYWAFNSPTDSRRQGSRTERKVQQRQSVYCWCQRLCVNCLWCCQQQVVEDSKQTGMW